MADDTSNGAVPPKATPGTPRPITVRLKPVVPKSEIQKTTEAEALKENPTQPKETVISASSGRTARVPIPAFDEMVGDTSGIAPMSATVKLRSVKMPGVTPAGSSPSKPVKTPVRESHKPGSNPLPPGLKPPSDVQVHAAKSKTSRISLDAAIGVAPEGPMIGGDSPKTIRLKRPAKLAGTGRMPTSATAPLEAQQKPKSRTAPIGKTSRIPDEAMPPRVDQSATVTQKKTLKIRKKGVPAKESSGDDVTDGVAMTPISNLGYGPVVSDNGPFTVFAGIVSIFAAIVILLMIICLGAQAIGPAAERNNIATVKLDMKLPWPGAISE